MTNHIPKQCPSPCPNSSDNGHGKSCLICDGGLFVCSVCTCAEGTLPTHCPEIKVSTEVQDEVINGTTDYIDGKWVNKTEYDVAAGDWHND